jgi:hypothetical protein
MSAWEYQPRPGLSSSEVEATNCTLAASVKMKYIDLDFKFGGKDERKARLRLRTGEGGGKANGHQEQGNDKHSWPGHGAEVEKVSL